MPAVQDLLALHRHAPERYPYLLETTTESRGERAWDILLAFPEGVLELRRPDSLYRDDERLPHADFFLELDRWQAPLHTTAPNPHGFPFIGGWFLFLAYELGALLEPTVPQRYDNRLPLAWAQRCPAAILRDRISGETWFLSEEVRPAQSQLVKEDIAALYEVLIPEAPRVEVLAEPRGWFVDAVLATQEAIRAGDLFQANLSRVWTAHTTEPAWVLYARLRQANPAPFAGIARIGGVSIVSSSPERLVAIRGGEVRVRPIAGTRPRVSVVEDEVETALLKAHPKERAEHVMLVDLARNDLGRVCTLGTVKVQAFMEVETYRYVHHLVSDVVGRVSDPLRPGEVIAAVFPGGTITGCPKVRAMQLIRAFEPQARGLYTGSMGYLGRDGSLDLNILIRTLLYDAGAVEVRAGAGIVADSVPHQEVAETEAKALGMLSALSRTRPRLGHVAPDNP